MNKPYTKKILIIIALQKVGLEKVVGKEENVFYPFSDK